MPDDLVKQERKLRELLLVSSLTDSQLEELKATPEIRRHLSLVAIIEKHQESESFKRSNEKAKDESVITKLLIGIGLGPPI